MASTNPFARTLHDVGLAAWFGGSLMGAIGLNGAAATAKDPRERTVIASEGWKRWTPVNAAAIGAHLTGATILLASDRKRIAGQEGVASLAGLKTGLTVAALAVTGVSRYLGRSVQDAGPVPAAGVTEPAPPPRGRRRPPAGPAPAAVGHPGAHRRHRRGERTHGRAAAPDRGPPGPGPPPAPDLR